LLVNTFKIEYNNFAKDYCDGTRPRCKRAVRIALTARPTDQKGTILESTTLTAILLYNATPNPAPRARSVTTIKKNKDKDIAEYFEILVKDLQKVQKRLVKKYQTEGNLKN
jgi:hypothetical protein